MDETVKYLKSLGANEVVSEEFTRTPEMTTLMKVGLCACASACTCALCVCACGTNKCGPLPKEYPRGKLGLNCVGGRSAANIVRLLEHNTTLVTYGGMSRQPLTIPTGALIFNNIKFVGFWMTHWNEVWSRERRAPVASPPPRTHSLTHLKPDLPAR
jgi:hypothetical protein